MEIYYIFMREFKVFDEKFMLTFDFQVNSKSIKILAAFVNKVHFAETHRKTSNFDMCVFNFISTCHFCFIQKIIYHLKKIEHF